MTQTSHQGQTKWVTDALLVICTLHLYHRQLGSNVSHITSGKVGRRTYRNSDPPAVAGLETWFGLMSPVNGAGTLDVRANYQEL
jgi:hypothetical protein